ncbi:Disease resistance protein RPS2 [Camellia lanceoleosa]|uniref:Disease resistance protein RPS2 n=1 Tax=Camellia lanceoleosa TaxID=1840588 RepID=A0ACC0IMQ4_9ERIC|nr:Disease resistance protein RPS2 [Camellia lanceoleosa]
MELPPQIGALRNLEIFDLEGTKIMYLPEEIGELISLKCFRVSFGGRANRYMDLIIPTKALSKFSELEELTMWWDAEVKTILNELSKSLKLKFLELYLQSVKILQLLRWKGTELKYPDSFEFRFIVGRLRRRLISRLPYEVEERFKKWNKWRKCLEYINGDGKPTEITEALNHAFVFFLDRHWTIKMLSDFGNKNLVNLKFCLLVECNEVQTIIDGNYEYPSGGVKEPVFKSLNYLSIHCMKNLQSIWKGPIEKGCLSCLRSLTLRMCPNLTTIFTPSLLDNLWQLEELVVEDCCKIKGLVTQESPNFKSGYVLRSLRRISLVDLPELVTISGGLIINPILTSLIVYNCPKLKILYAKEISSTSLKIKGEKEWLETLKWNESESSNIWPTFEELGSGEDLMDQLDKDIYSHQLGMDF